MTNRKKVTVNLTSFEAKVLTQALEEFMYHVDMQHRVDEGKAYPLSAICDITAARRALSKLEPKKEPCGLCDDGWVRVPDGYGCVAWDHCHHCESTGIKGGKYADLL